MVAPIPSNRATVEPTTGDLLSPGVPVSVPPSSTAPWGGRQAWWMVLLLTASCLSAQPDPYRRLRDATLGYHGPDLDLSHLPELRIGWFGPTNRTDSAGADLWTAAQMAWEDAQLQNPISALRPPPSQIRLIPCWSTDPWGAGIAQLARMVYQDQPIALLGSIDSASTHLAEQVAAKANLPLVSPVATDPSVTLAGVPWMFSCAPSDDAVARVLVEDILRILEGSPGVLALLSTTDHESRMTTRAVVRELNRCQRPPDFRFDLPPGAALLEAQSQALQKARPQAVLIVANATNAARLTRLVRTLPAPPAHLFGTPAMARRAYREMAGAQAAGVRYPSLAHPNLADPETASFIERFRVIRQHPPEDDAFLTYDATRLLLAALARSGPSRAQLRESLASLGPWRGLSGFIHFDGTGQNGRTDLRMIEVPPLRKVTSFPVPATNSLSAAQAACNVP